MKPILVTIPISHYGERARWALDHALVDYDEQHVLQLFGWAPALWHGGRRTLPILRTAQGCLNDSADVVRWADERARASLYPQDARLRAEVERLEHGFASELGVETRRLMYDVFFRNFDAFSDYNAGSAPAWQAAALRAGQIAVSVFARRYLDVLPEALTRGRACVARTMDEVAARMADGRPYLVGERFTAADLTFATMMAPLTAPASYGVPLPEPARLPAEGRELVQATREHPAGRFALRLYEERPVRRGRLSRLPRAARVGWPDLRT